MNLSRLQKPTYAYRNTQRNRQRNVSVDISISINKNKSKSTNMYKPTQVYVLDKSTGR